MSYSTLSVMAWSSEMDVTLFLVVISSKRAWLYAPPTIIITV